MASKAVNLISVFTLSGPLVGLLGWAVEWNWLFWTGVALASLNLFMNLASGAMRFPVLPLAAMAIGGWFADSWLRGTGIGLLLYTTLEGVSGRLSSARRNSSPTSLEP